jgi:imidazoleglycerol-phosphate dehydratase
MTKRVAQKKRATKETDISLKLDLDRRGAYSVRTGIPFFDHMLELFAKHSGIAMTLKAKGDTDVDYHHTVEDIAIVLGEALKDALGSKKGIQRYGSSHMVMDEVLVRVVLDISGRPYLVYNLKGVKGKIRDFDTRLVEHFFDTLVKRAFITLHIDILRGEDSDLHHILEAVFKGFAQALKSATALSGDGSVPSTKGVIE